MMELCAKAFGGNVTFGVACEDGRIFAACFWGTTQETLAHLRNSLPPNTPTQVAAEPSAFAEKALRTIRDIYEGKGTTEDIPLALDRCTPYTRRVVGAVCRIPVGYVASYGSVAEAAGGGARAVGNVMASNVLAPLVPCHRVVTSSLGLGGYGIGGLRVKYEFLRREKRGYAQPIDVSTEMRPLRVFPVEFVVQKVERFFKK